MTSHSSLSRRRFLRLAAAVGGTLVAAQVVAGCQPKVVEKIVKETVIVAGTPKVVEKEITRVVEKVVQEKAPQGVVTIKYQARAGDAEEVLYARRLIEFNRDQANIKAVLEQFPGGNIEYDGKIMAMVAAGTLGDAIWTAVGLVNHYFFANKGLLADHGPLIEADGFDLGQFYASSVESCKLRGTMYGLPIKAHPGGGFIYYNKTLFEEDGLPQPSEDWTFDDMLEAAQALSKDLDGDGQNDQWGLKMYTGRLQNATLRAFGGEFINAEGTKAILTKPESTEALRWQYDLYHKHNVCPTPQVMAFNEFQLTASGKMAMFQAGPWAGPSLRELIQQGEEPGRFEWWVIPLPWGPAKVRGSQAEVDCCCVTQISKHKQEAFELAKYFTDKEAGIQLCLGDSVCGARPDLKDDERINGTYHTSNDTEYFRIMREVTEGSMPFYYPANFRGQEAYVHYTQSLDPLWVGDAEPTDAFIEEANKSLQAILDRPPA